MSNLAISEETAISPADVFMDGKSITERELELSCQEIVVRLQETSDTQEIEQAIINLNGVQAFAGKALSKLIYGYSGWYKTNHPDGNFAEWYTQKFGGEKLTVQKHEAIGELLMDDEVPANVKQLPSKELVSVARAKQSGYDLEDVWDDIAMAGSEAEVNSIVRKVKGKQERSGTLSLKMYADGSIMVFFKTKDGRTITANAGWFNVVDRDNPETEEEVREVLRMAIARYTNNTHTTVEAS